MNRMRICACLMTVVILAGLMTGCGHRKAAESNIESVNIHFSGGLSGHYNDDLCVFEKDGKYYISFSTTNQDTTDRIDKKYEITPEEFEKCTEMLDVGKLPTIRQSNASDAIYYTVTIKEKGKDGVELPRINPGYNPYTRIRELWAFKNGDAEKTADDEYEDMIWKCFKESGAQNAVLYTTPIEENGRPRYPLRLFGYGFDYYYPDQKAGYAAIIDELRSEMASKAGEDALEDFQGSFINSSEVMFFSSYASFLLRRNFPDESREAILKSKYKKIEISGKTAYTRTVKSGDVMAFIVLIPESKAYKVYLTDNARDGKYVDRVQKLLIEEGWK